MQKRYGKYLADWRDAAGVRRRKAFDTRKEAEDHARHALARSPSTPKPIGPAATIAQAAAEWTRAQAHNPNTQAALAALVKDYGGMPQSPALPANGKMAPPSAHPRDLDLRAGPAAR
jgi:hypothetical protein